MANDRLRDAGVVMAAHNYVVRRIASAHKQQWDQVAADIRGYPKPPRFYGPYGRAYIPDVYVGNRRLVYEVKEYRAHEWAVPKLKAFVASPLAASVILVLCTGSPAGTPRVQHFMWRHNVDCEVMSYQDLPFW